MAKSGNIFLIGPMGAGKSTIGRLLAKAMEREFVDSDREIERKTGVSIPLIFDYEGEAGFRRREAEVIDELTQLDGVVLATGGGSVLRPENQAHLKARGFVVYLHCPIEKQLERTHKDANRPLLQTENPRERLLELFRMREPIYRQIADQVIDTGMASSRTIVRHILKAQERHLSKHPL
jgi:shikimate kinase